MDQSFSFDGFFLDCYQFVRTRPYNIFSPEEVLDLKAKLCTSVLRSTFRATQYDQYVKDGYSPIFSRGDGVIGEFIDFDVNQCAKLLCLMDQDYDHSYLPKMLDKLIDDKNISDYDLNDEKNYNDVQFARVYSRAKYDELYYEAYTMLSGIIDKEVVIGIPYATCGASMRAALDLGFEVYYFENDVFDIPIKDEDKICNHHTLEELLEADCNEMVVFVHNCLMRCPSLVSQVLSHDFDVLVCDSLSVYEGFADLYPTCHRSMYQTATSVKNYMSCGILKKIDDPQKYEQLNPEIIVRFKQFIFCGLESLGIVRFLMMLDPQRKMKYYAVGSHADSINSYFKLQSFVPTGPVLYIVKDASFIFDAVRDNDAVYSVLTKREMGYVYLSKILPLMGLVSTNVLMRLGFIKCIDKISNAVIYGGLINSTVDCRSVERNLPYLIKQPEFVEFRYGSGCIGNNSVVSVEEALDGYKLVIFKSDGFIKLSTSCAHPLNAVLGSKHLHAFHVVPHVQEELTGWVINPNKNMLMTLPRLFKLDTMRAEYGVMKHLNAYGIDTYIHDLRFDIRVKIVDGWVLNPQGQDTLFCGDYGKLEAESFVRRLSPSKYCNELFKIRAQIEFEHMRVRFGLFGFNLYETENLIALDVAQYRLSGVANEKLLMCSGIFRHEAMRNKADRKSVV